MERFYDGDQEKLFAEARVVNPFRKGPLINRNQSSQSSLVNKILYYLIIKYKNYIKINDIDISLYINNIYKIFSPEELQQMVLKNVEFVLRFNHLQYVYKYTYIYKYYHMKLLII